MPSYVIIKSFIWHMRVADTYKAHEINIIIIHCKWYTRDKQDKGLYTEKRNGKILNKEKNMNARMDVHTDLEINWKYDGL